MDKTKTTFEEKTVTLFDMMPDEVQKGLEKSIEQSKKGLGRSHQDVMKKYNKSLQPKSSN